MKTQIPRCRIATALLFIPLLVQAQPAPSEGEPVVLSAFEVHSSQDAGYRAEKSVATTGISEDLLKTPLPITVVTEQFLNDAELSGFLGSLSYVSGIALDPNASDGNVSLGGQPNLNRFRGQPFNGTFRNGLKIVYGFDTENVDRVEVAKGPMAVFVGGATLGGEVNVVTKKPTFYKFNEFFARVGSHDSMSAKLDSTGPISKTLAYRLITAYEDKNTWRDYSHSHTEFFNPQLTWRPFKRLTTNIDASWRNRNGNDVSQNTSSTENYLSDFSNPRQALLDLGKRRTTGASAGLPYTTAEYRSRIGRAFGTWRQDVYDAFKYWDSLGAGEGLTDGNAPDGRRYNYDGPNAHFETNVRAFESETVLVANDWLQVKLQGRYLNAWQENDFNWFGSRIYADGSTPLAGYGGQRWLLKNNTAKMEFAFTKKIKWFDNKLLLGVQSTDNDLRQSYLTLDYTAAGSVAASPNVFGSPNPLTGANIYNYFDPAVQAFPDSRLISRWADEINPAGVASRTWVKDRSRAVYAAGSSGVWNDRLIFTGGIRRSRDQTTTTSTDRFDQVVLSGGAPVILATPHVYTNSWMAGLTFEIVKNLNLYASYNYGETYQSGYLVGRAANAAGTVPQDIVPVAERTANPKPNTTGEGKELGLKFRLLDGKLTGSFGWFSLTRGGIIVVDSGRTALDPRNVGTEVDPNPATADPSVRYKVEWDTPIKGNSTEGFEADVVWTPWPSYSVVVGASHLTKNEMTVDHPPSSDPVVLRSYLVLNGRPLPNSPDDTLRIFQRYTVKTGHLQGVSFSLGARYQSSQMPAADDVNWGLVFPGYWVEDAIIGYETKIHGKPVTFQLSSTNIANKAYFTGNRVYGPPREIAFSTRVRF